MLIFELRLLFLVKKLVKYSHYIIHLIINIRISIYIYILYIKKYAQIVIIISFLFIELIICIYFSEPCLFFNSYIVTDFVLFEMHTWADAKFLTLQKLSVRIFYTISRM